MSDVVRYPNGDINWHANGWPEPNPGAETRLNGFTTDGMPDDIFVQWMDECDELDEGWEVDW